MNFIFTKVLESPSTYVFGELLDISSVKELSNTEYAPYLTLLDIFAYGTYQDYKKQKSTLMLPELSEQMLIKLKYLSIVSLARFHRHIPYDVLMKELDMSTIRELEDLLIEAIYADVIKGLLFFVYFNFHFIIYLAGTMDQESKLLEVDETISRDVKEEDFQTITNILNEWCRNCDNMLINIEQQISIANNLREESIQAKHNQEIRLAQMKKNSRELEDLKDILKHDSRDNYEKKRPTLKLKNIYKGGINKSSRKD